MTSGTPSQRVLSKRAFQAIRNRMGPSADTIEGIAEAGRGLIRRLPGVGDKVMTEVDEVLESLGLEWAPDFAPLAMIRRSEKTTISSDSALKLCFDRARVLLEQDELNADAILDWARSLDRFLATETNLVKDDCFILIQRYLHGATLDEAGKALGVTRSAVQQKTSSLAPTSKEFRSVLIYAVVAENQAEISSRLNDGATPLMIAESPLLSEFGFAAPALITAMKELGLVG